MIDRTFPRELSITDAELLIVDRIRTRIGDSCVLFRDYFVSTDDFGDKFGSDLKTYYNSEIRFWPHHLVVDGTTFSGTTSGTVSGFLDSPSVMNYHYLIFDTQISGRNLDFWLDSFSLSDYEIWTVYNSVDLTSVVKNPECITDYLVFLKACLDCIELLRSMRVLSHYTSMKVQDGDTNYSKQLLQGVDPMKDLFTAIQNEFNDLVKKCNTRPYSGGVRIE